MAANGSKNSLSGCSTNSHFYFDYYISILLSFHIMNNLVDQIILYEDKQSVIIRKFNFLGFRRETPSRLYNILELNYGKKFKNFVINLNSPIFFISKVFK